MDGLLKEKLVREMKQREFIRRNYVRFYEVRDYWHWCKECGIKICDKDFCDSIEELVKHLITIHRISYQ